MKRLIGVLNNYGFYFVDSKTTKDTVVKEVMEIYNMKYITRDIFLDNKENKEYIKKQIKKAIKLAKRSGFTIAICHPKKATFDALQESKKLLDSSVEILNIYEVEGLLK
jgi:hypothetical protein